MCAPYRGQRGMTASINTMSDERPMWAHSCREIVDKEFRQGNVVLSLIAYRERNGIPAPSSSTMCISARLENCTAPDAKGAKEALSKMGDFVQYYFFYIM